MAINGGRVEYAPRQAREYNADELVQYKVPDYSLRDLLSAIPRHCFERSAVHSFSYVAMDLVQAAALALGAHWIDQQLPSLDFSNAYFSNEAMQAGLRFALWSLYGLLQGMVFTGLWVIAHECGHQAFSSSTALNDTVGWVLHSALFVPYHSWRISHARHHASTGHLTRDEVFVPRTREQYGRAPLQPADANPGDVTESSSLREWLNELLEDAPMYNLFALVLQQLLGWPLYLLFNVSGQPHYPTWTNHFNPNSVIFAPRHRWQILVSDLGLLMMGGCLVAWAHYSSGGWGEVLRYYLVPYLWTNHWLVMITYLQHTDPLLPHYRADMWTFPRGALCTIDRTWLGPIGAHFFHGIAETHVLHHVSSKIPHYHAWEATEALKKRLGVHYMKSEENVFVSLWKSMRSCRFVDDEPVAFYRNADGVPSSVATRVDGADSGVALSD